MTEVYLVRHGQASFAAENYDQLSETGLLQARWLGEYFQQRGIGFDHFLSGDMQRHIQTLEGIFEGMQLPDSTEKTIRPGFNEYDFRALGLAYGKEFPNDELYQKVLTSPQDKKLHYRFLHRVLIAWSDGRIADIAESWQDFQKRVYNELLKLQRARLDKNDRVLVVSSGGTMGMFVGLALGLSADKTIDLNLQIKNTALIQFFFNSTKMNLHQFNAIPHLDEPGRLDKVTYG